MKTKIKDTIKKCVQLAYENRQSWRLWITVTAFLIISLGTYAVSAMHYNTKTAYTTPPSTSETEKNRNSTRNGISDIPSSTRPKDSQEPESDKTTQDSQKDTESTTQSTSDATKPAGSTPSATPKSTSSSNTIKPPTSTPPLLPPLPALHQHHPFLVSQCQKAISVTGNMYSMTISLKMPH